MNPETFDTLIDAIKDNSVFRNNSNNDQISVEQQAAIALYRFGHYGNAASVQDVAFWSGFGYGTVDRCTQRVMVALCKEFRTSAISFPTEAEMEEAKVWVEENSCAGWHDSCLFVDRTLVLFST
jgi:hypothetical protein